MNIQTENEELWIDTRLQPEEMNFLWDAISDPEINEDANYNQALVGNIFKSEQIEDRDNWFYESVLKKLTEKMFYRDWNNFSKYYIEKERPLPKFELDTLWVNYMRQHEFNPLPHYHSGLFSFAIFMKIPIHWKEQHALSFSAHSISPSASDFQFVWSRKDSEVCMTRNFSLSSEDEGRMLFFPATLQHQVYPFYECEEERITISGNIVLHDANKLKEQERVMDQYEEKENMLKMLENSAKHLKEEVRQLKYNRRKDKII